MEQNLVNEFIDVLRNDRRLSEQTIPNFQRGLFRFTEFLESKGCYSFFEVTGDLFDEYRAGLADQNYSDVTVYDRGHVVFEFYEWLHIQKVLIYNPCRKPLCKSPHRLPRRVPALEEIKEAYSLLKHCSSIEDQRNYVIVDLAFSCGIRRCEILYLNVSDVLVNEQLIRVKGKYGKERLVPVGKKSLVHLQNYISHIRPQFLKKNGVKALLLTNRSNGKRISRTSISEAIARMRTKYGLSEDVTPHSLRHAFAIGLLRNGAHISDISTLLGHSSIETTQIYTRLLPLDLKDHHKKYHPRG